MNLEPLKSFLEEEISPSELAALLDNLLDDYLDRTIKLNELNEDIGLHVNIAQFFNTVKRLQKTLIMCK